MAKRTSRATLPRSTRIRGRNDFRRILGRKLRASDRWITLYADRGPAGHARLGIAAGRQLGNAVQRNRIKRLVREAFRRLRHELPAGTDWVIIPRAGPEPTLDELQQSIRQLARRLETKLEPHKRGERKIKP